MAGRWEKCDSQLETTTSSAEYDILPTRTVSGRPGVTSQQGGATSIGYLTCQRLRQDESDRRILVDCEGE